MRAGRPRKHDRHRHPNGKIIQLPAAEAWSVYFIGAADGRVKIGYARSPAARLTEIQIGCADELSIIGVVRCAGEAECRATEKWLHVRLKAAGRHIRGEWFRLNDDEVEEIASKWNARR